MYQPAWDHTSICNRYWIPHAVMGQNAVEVCDFACAVPINDCLKCVCSLHECFFIFCWNYRALVLAIMYEIT